MTHTGGARDAPPCLAIDIGATKVEAALVTPDGELSARARCDVANHHDYFVHAVVGWGGST